MITISSSTRLILKNLQHVVKTGQWCLTRGLDSLREWVMIIAPLLSCSSTTSSHSYVKITLANAVPIQRLIGVNNMNNGRLEPYEQRNNTEQLKNIISDIYLFWRNEQRNNTRLLDNINTTILLSRCVARIINPRVIGESWTYHINHMLTGLHIRW